MVIGFTASSSWIYDSHFGVANIYGNHQGSHTGGNNNFFRVEKKSRIELRCKHSGNFKYGPLIDVLRVDWHRRTNQSLPPGHYGKSQQSKMEKTQKERETRHRGTAAPPVGRAKSTRMREAELQFSAFIDFR